MQKKDEKNNQVYAFAELSQYSFKQRLIIRLAGFVFYLLIVIIGKTNKFTVIGQENFDEIINAGKIPIYNFWHNKIFLATYFFRNRGILVMSSQSFDAEYVARCIQRFGFGVVKGSSTRGGVAGLVNMIKLMKEGYPTGFSIDGPKGPIYVAKPGSCLLAKKTGNPVLPFTVQSEKYWEVKSWDKLQIPKPFSKCVVIFDKPMYIESKTDEETLENKRTELQKALENLTIQGEKFWGNKY